MKQIDVLPDDVLLGIFDFYTITDSSYEGVPSDESKKAIEAWQVLVHVCRRWRSLVLGSPRRLNLRLYCTYQTPARDTLDVWPALPLIVDSRGITMGLSSDTHDIIAALGQSHRICQVDFYFADWLLEEVLAAMWVPFPELTNLRLSSLGTRPPTIPDSFLGGSAPPRLQYFKLRGIPFPGLPKLLLSATHLVELRLLSIPHSGYISPKAVVALISALSSLRILSLGFQSHQSRPASGCESGGQPRQKRFILPALRRLDFRGVTEYLEDLVTRIDTPQLDEMHIAFFSQIDFDFPQLAQFINRLPTLRERDKAHVQFNDYFASVVLLAKSRTLKIGILGREPDRQLSSVAQVCNSPMHPLSAVEDLYIEYRYRRLIWKNHTIENTLWLQLLLPYTAVKNLYLSNEFAPGIAAALQDLVGGTIAEVLPSLQNIFVERLEPSGLFQENIGQFVAARQLSNRPVATVFWDI